MTLSDLCKKDVIQMATGTNLGRVDDLNFDGANAAVLEMVLFGRPKLFGLLGREADVKIPWADVVNIGADVVLVKTELPAPPRPARGGLLAKWFT